MSDIVKEAKYIKSDVTKNNNKFWYITLYNDASVITKWGRVGDEGQSKTKTFTSQASAESFFEKKCKEKQRTGRNGEIAYRPLNVINSASGQNCISVKSKSIDKNNLKSIATKQIKTNNPNVKKLIEYLTKVNAHNINAVTGGQITYNDTTGLFSTPLGIVTQDNIDDALNILIKIGKQIANKKYNNELQNLTNDYLMLVPQNIGRKRLDINKFWSDLSTVQKQKAIVDSLQASLISASKIPNKIQNSKQPEEKIFDVQLFLVEDPKVIKTIKNKYNKTRKAMHRCNHLDVKKVYKVSITTMKESFEKDGLKIGNIMELWHGTRVSNLLSILKGGLIIPSATSSHVTGRMFGNGLYFSDQSTKSLNYSHGLTWGTGPADNNCFMFLADVAMGKYYIPSSYSNGPFPKKGYDSVFAKAGRSRVYNNEMIVYKVSQSNLTYLVEFA